MSKCATKYCRKKTNKGRTHCSTCRSRRQKENNPLRYYYSAHKSNSKQRGIPFNLPFHHWVYFWMRHPKEWKQKISGQEAWEIDRKDPNKGYEIDNLQLLSKFKNVEKCYEEDRFMITAKWHPKFKHTTVSNEAPF